MRRAKFARQRFCWYYIFTLNWFHLLLMEDWFLIELNYQFLFFSLCISFILLVDIHMSDFAVYISVWKMLRLCVHIYKCELLRVPINFVVSTVSFTLGIKAIRSGLSSRFPTRRDWNRLKHRATSFLFYFFFIKKWEKPLLFRNRIASFFCSALWVTFCSIFYRNFCHRYKYRWSIEEGAFRW